MEETHKQAIKLRKEREKEQRVQGILDAAKVVLLSKGYRESTMIDIAHAAGITKPTIYRYFRSKDDLCFSLILPTVEMYIHELDTLKEQVLNDEFKNGRSFIGYCLQRLFLIYQSSPALFIIINFLSETGEFRRLSSNVSVEISTRMKTYVENEKVVLQLAMEKGLIKHYDPEVLTDIIIGLFNGLILIIKINEQIRHGELSDSDLFDKMKVRIDLAEELLGTILEGEKGSK